MKYAILICLCLALACCSPRTELVQQPTPDVAIRTNLGEIVIRLYDETPLHRDNMLKLVRDQVYDSVLFHRVIETFMIQAGDIASKSAGPSDTLGDSDLPYQVPAEFHPERFHKRGAVGAARDNNPARASSSTQFYIVQGKVYNDSTLDAQQGRINGWLAMNKVVNDPANRVLADRYEAMQENEDYADSMQYLSDSLQVLADLVLKDGDLYTIPPNHRTHYKTAGGAAHLDQNYTVFGEVIRGMSVVDSIAAVATNAMDRPLKDVRILRVELLERE